MKKVILVLGFLFCLPAQADYYGHHSNDAWIGPAIGIGLLGLTVGIGISQSYQNSVPIYIPPQPRYVPPAYYPYGYHYITLWDPNCYCYRNILVPN